MTSKRFLIMTTALLLAQLSFASTSSAQSRLNELSSRLATEANEFADASYRGTSGVFRDNRSNVQAAMLAHHFNGGARLFNRMVNDRLRRGELRDAFQVLQSLATPIDSNNLQPSRWSNIQRLMSDIAAELSNNPRDDRDYRDDQDVPGARSGRMTWRGRVDDDVRIVIRGGRADVETIGGNPYYDAATNFTASLPRRRVTVSLLKRKGRGEIFIEQQPTRENDFAAVIRVRDPRGGASDYEFEVSW
ncbi:MAG TPA: hypothetical protein VFH15_13665 [Pyrinomonadaceae bacterium]|nr:hypothetical protein [Pyrinomonadaceae bacterium]